MIRRTASPSPRSFLVEIVPGAALIAVGGGHNYDLLYLAPAALTFLGALTIIPIRKVPGR
jgi:hypothetical protein